MKADLTVGLQWVTGRSLVLLLALFFSIQAAATIAQGNCAMEQDIVGSWTSTVEADKKDIAKIQYGQAAHDSPQLTKLQGKLQRDSQRLQEAQTRLAICRNRTNSTA